MSSPYYRFAFVGATVLILAYLLFRIIAPFWGPIIWAAFLAFMCHPLYVWLTRKLRGRKNLAAGLIAGSTPIVVLGPIALLGAAFAAQAADLAQRAQSVFATFDRSGGGYSLANIPGIGKLVHWIEANSGYGEQQLRDWIAQGSQAALKWAASLGGNVVIGVLGTVFGFVIAVVLLYFFIRDGERWWARAMRLIPMEPHRRDLLIEHLKQVTRAVVYGTGVTAAVQGFATGVGFAIVGFDSYIVFGVVAALLSLLPLGGAALVWVPGVAFLAWQGRWGMAAFLLVWGILISSLDNFLRPLLVSSRAKVSTLTVFIGVLGGAAAFGAIGLIVGPLVLTLITALFDYVEENAKPSSSGGAAG